MRYSTQRTGFTLIELLMVIAIIGMLAAIVMADLQTAKTSAQDTVAIQNLNSIRTQAGLYYDEYTTYVGLCSFPKIAQALDESAEVTQNAHNCDAVAGQWAAEIPISTGEYYCVDVEGNATTTNSSKGAATTVCF